ncbi:hypothetical protein D3C84_1167260 [compost metagenome]
MPSIWQVRHHEAGWLVEQRPDAQVIEHRAVNRLQADLYPAMHAQTKDDRWIDHIDDHVLTIAHGTQQQAINDLILYAALPGQ